METTYRVQVTPISNSAPDLSDRNFTFHNYDSAVAYFFMQCCELDATVLPDIETLFSIQTNLLCDAHNQVITLEIIFS
jgi:hypothetical protein